MFQYLQSLLTERGMAPHGYCLLWQPGLIWTHVISDALIGLSYASIPIVIARFLTQRRDVQFGWVVWMFALFIMACGLTHFMSIVTLWVPAYGLEGLIKMVTAAASVSTAVALWPLLPAAVAVPSPAQLQKVNDELRALVIERDRALAAFEHEAAERQQAEEMLRQSQKMEAVGQLTSGIAHDFNNLLQIILASLDRAGRLAGDNPPLHRCIGTAAQGAERAATLTDQLLAFSRKQPLLAATHDLNAVVEGLQGLLQRTLGQGARLELDLAPALPSVVIDPNQAENAIINLAVNARDAMPAGGTVMISTHRGADAEGREVVAVRVADTGVGMTAEVRERVFEPFFTTKAVGQGTGLGLSQVYGFAKQAGGDVTVESAPGQGTAVELRLPAAPTGEEA